MLFTSPGSVPPPAFAVEISEKGKPDVVPDLRSARAACAPFSGGQAPAEPLKNVAASNGPKGCLLEPAGAKKAERSCTDKRNWPGNGSIEKATLARLEKEGDHISLPNNSKRPKAAKNFPL